MPKYQHNCDTCRFLGTHFGCDVYVCGQAVPFPTLIARYGDEPPDYSSSPLCLLRDCMGPGHRISGQDDDGSKWTMPYTEYVFSDRCLRGTKAMMQALIVAGLDALNPGEPDGTGGSVCEARGDVQDPGGRADLGTPQG